MENKPIEITLWPYDFNAIYDGRVEHLYTPFKTEFIKGEYVLLREYLPVEQVFSGRVLFARIDEVVVYPSELPLDVYCTIYLEPIKTGTYF